MSTFIRIQLVLALAAGILIAAGCGGAVSAQGSPSNPPSVSAPTIATTPALNGAAVVTLSTSTPGATIYYTVDGSAPTASSPIYEAPFLVASNLTVNAIASSPGDSNSAVATKTFALQHSLGNARLERRILQRNRRQRPAQSRRVDLRHRQQRLRQQRA